MDVSIFVRLHLKVQMYLALEIRNVADLILILKQLGSVKMLPFDDKFRTLKVWSSHPYPELNFQHASQRIYLAFLKMPHARRKRALYTVNSKKF